ncbi:hypothetical protein PFICI_07947 [Pestalotiopsis fici W106-1]|uniref:FAD-binding PCMH-type domain-containing protein n=1 Tax=Pestalotiopsis fici (strain W106-1 / CGMCC3.15140) TaxID=1229662 RepID=W3X2P9_PESFW|nr:uncharacterized protein PFICI_07947 [Pestalotiopsis fici W106-1]ETS80418.1 hypothetical protein PFICI_07947 [Pestalotiopsis fici W106-1]
MKSSVASLLFFSGLSSLAAGASIPRYFEKQPITRRDLTSAEVRQELGDQVSSGTLIYGADDAEFAELTSRWTDYSKPDVQVAIEPATEADVATIVNYCNDNSIDFLALNGGHGLAYSLKSFSGLQISMWQLDNITISDDAGSAWFGGGTKVGNVTQYLSDRGYVTTTGGCECVGMMGAGLGGGHGRYEGLYGMISDNILELNLVLANGTSIVVSESENSDLLWAMKGAGHNFGIVTSYKMTIWPLEDTTWHWHNYIWRGDQLETVFDALNTFHGNGTTPVNMAFEVGNFVMNTTITSDEPVLFWTFAYRGPADEAEELLVPFNAIDAEMSVSGDVPYTGIATAQGTSWDSAICQHGQVHITSTVGLVTYNLTAERQIFEGFKQRAQEYPELVAASFIMHEGYATEGVDNIASDSSAYPFRSDHHLMLFNAVSPSSDYDDLALAWANEARDQWNAGQPGRAPHAYVNYASGLETVEEWYGEESWRIERLTSLKTKYDPDNRFRYYNPIVAA